MLGVMMRRCVGRLRLLGRERGGGGGFISVNSCYCDHSTTHTSWNPRFNLSPFSHIATFGAYTHTKHFEADRALVSALPKHDSDNGEKVEKQKLKKSNKRMINLSELFNKDEVHLIRYKDKQPVQVEQLAGKVIVLLFAPRCITSDSFQNDTKLLMEVYDELQPKGFEVILVTPNKLKVNPKVQIPVQEFFDKEFSWMPWAAIPYSDATARRHVQRILGVSRTKLGLSTIYVIDPNGRILQRNLEYFQIYGALGFPFTNERIKFLMESEYDAIVKQPSLEKLLASRQRDYVITNKGEKVPIHTLEGKVVALYFHEDGYTRLEFTAELKKAYHELAKSKKDFEVVLIYSSEGQNCGYRPSENNFWNRFKNMPWLALPFGDPSEKKLVKVLEIYRSRSNPEIAPPKLVIFGPGGEFVEPLGCEVLMEFGVTAYPFTRKKVAQLYTEKVQKLKLEMLWNASTIFSGKDGSQVPLSHFVGKRVILFVERLALFPKLETVKIKFLKSLKEKYLQMKGTDDQFEVIHILENRGNIYPKKFSRKLSTALSQAKSSVVEHIGDMPWLVSVPSDPLPADFDSYFCHGDHDEVKCVYSLLLAFGQDGKVVRNSVYPTVDDANFPFCSGGLEDEALAQLTTTFGWNYWDYCANKGRIYSVKDKLLKVDI